MHGHRGISLMSINSTIGAHRIENGTLHSVIDIITTEPFDVGAVVKIQIRVAFKMPRAYRID